MRGDRFDFQQAHDLLPPVEDTREALFNAVDAGRSQQVIDSFNKRYDRAVDALHAP